MDSVEWLASYSTGETGPDLLAPPGWVADPALRPLPADVRRVGPLVVVALVHAGREDETELLHDLVELLRDVPERI